MQVCSPPPLPLTLFAPITHDNVWMFLGVAEPNVCSLLCCGVDIVQFSFSLVTAPVPNAKKLP